MKTNMHFWSYLAYFFLERKMFRTQVLEEIETQLLVFNNPFLEIRVFYDNVKKIVI